MIWNEKQETMPREELEVVQLRRLKAQVERVYATVP
ncbi:MAG: phenylacetate--CoA ligase, partial [Desulfobulbaceae bacterium]|nr:phenylacetate--CoA ligase [Desulfobulbaceae bacterium]